MVLGQKIVLSLFLSIFSLPHTHTHSLFFTISFLFSPSSSTSFLISVLRYALMPVSLPFLPSLLSIFSPLLFPSFSIQFLSSYLIDLEKGKYTVCSTLFTLSLSFSLYTHAPPTLSLPLTYLISLEHEIRNVVFSFFFFFTGEKGSGRLRSSRRENSTRGGGSLRGTLYYYPPPSPFPKTVDQKNPFSLPFLFLFFSILTNKRISLISSCESQCIVFFLFFLKNQSIYGMIRHLTGLPCKALERRGLRIYAERHARRVQLFRYKFVHFL